MMKKRPFSLKIYLLIVLALSWPFQIAYPFLGESFRPILLVSMVMAGVATYICGRFVFSDGFANAGWKWGKPKHYFFAFTLPLLLWLVPIWLEQVLGMRSGLQLELLTLLKTFALSFATTLVPAFGEEFSWRGYLLPRLLKVYTPRKSLLTHGFITWFWHLPFVVMMGLEMPGNNLITVPVVALISLFPTVMHAVVFAYFYSVSSSLAVATVYHSAFDEVRDTLLAQVGFGPLVEVWQMALLTGIGMIILWKKKWPAASAS